MELSGGYVEVVYFLLKCVDAIALNRYNSAMKKILYTVAGLLAVSVAPAAEQTPAEVAPQAQLPMVNGVDLMTMKRDSRCGQVLVTCLIGGQPMRMMLDTGATHTVLHDESVARLSNPRWLDTSGMKFKGNSSQRPKILIAPLQAGPAESPQHPIMVISLAAVRSMLAEPIDGILGMDVLGSLPFTFDLRSEECYWGVPAAAKLVPLYGRRDDNGRMFVQVQCCGKPMELLLDTGSSITRVYEDEWVPGKAKKIAAHLGDVDKASRAQVMAGKPADMELAPGVVLPAVAPIFCPRNDRSMLGMDALKGAVLIHLPGISDPYGSFFTAN